MNLATRVTDIALISVSMVAAIERVTAMKNFLILLLMCFICRSVGCAKYYYQEGKTFEECAKDRANCLSDLKKRLGTISERPGNYEYKYIEDCMKRKGYKLVTENQLPLDAKRLDPDSSLQGQVYGYRRRIAGTLDEE